MKTIKYFKKLLLDLKKDKIKINNHDVYLVSFPKSGNTWVRFFLINYLYNSNNEEILYEDLEKFIPSIHKSSINQINSIKRKKIIKSHFVKPDYPRIIYVVRDGRDALVSYFYYLRDLKKFDGTFEEFYYSPASADAGTWDEHLRSALNYEAKHVQNILFVKYEDLKHNPEYHFKKIIEFLGYEVENIKLELAIERSSFKNLSKKHKTNEVYIDDKKVDFFRKGISDQWRGYFNEELNNHFVNKSKDVLNRFNYELK